MGLAGSSTAAGIVWAEPDDGEESSVCVIRGGERKETVGYPRDALCMPDLIISHKARLNNFPGEGIMALHPWGTSSGQGKEKKEREREMQQKQRDWIEGGAKRRLGIVQKGI